VSNRWDCEGRWKPRPRSAASAEHYEYAHVVRVLQTLSATGESETSEDDNPIAPDQRPAVSALLQRNAIDLNVVEPATAPKLERGGSLR
jgi:hypothetical protein